MPRCNSKKTILLCLILAFIPVALYVQVIGFEFVDFDDFQYVTRNENVSAGFSLEHVAWAFSSLYASNWHPLTWLSHMLDVQLFGLKPGGHHLVNVLFHTINTVLLFLVLKRLTGKIMACAAVAALFAAHPLHVESVAFVAERKDVLSTMFWLLTMAAYVGYVRQQGLVRYLLVVACYTLGLMAKPMLVTLPFVLLLLDYWPLERLSVREKTAAGVCRAGVGFRRLLWEKRPLLALAAASCTVTMLAQDKSGSVQPFEFLYNSSNALLSYLLYLQKTIWPTRLAVFYPLQEHIPWWEVTASALLLTAISFVTLRAARRHPYLLVGWLWYLGSLVPVIGIVQVGKQAMADRYTYIPLIGIFIMLVFGINEASARWRYRQALLRVAAGVVFAALAAVTWFQVGYWRNGVTLFEHAVNVTTGNYLAHHNLGVALMNKGRNVEAWRQFNEALRIKPDYKTAYYNLGNLSINMGDISRAIQAYKRAIGIDPDYIAAHKRLAEAYTRSGRHDLAVEEMKSVTALESAQ